MSIKKAKNLIDKLDEVKLNKGDLTKLALEILYDIDGETAQHHRAKIEALRLLSEFVIEKKQEEGFGDEAILRVLAGGKS
jgi:hypothetical protein